MAKKKKKYVLRNIIRECDSCGREDAINPITGMCPSCDRKKMGGVF
jgi:ribosomal protein S14